MTATPATSIATTASNAYHSGSKEAGDVEEIAVKATVILSDAPATATDPEVMADV